MKYITKFDTESNYLTFSGSKDYVLPNVSYCEQEKSVKHNYIAPPPPQHNGIEYVDLGLPSGTKWAKCNVGAKSETDYGLYFAWGETEGYSGYTLLRPNCIHVSRMVKRGSALMASIRLVFTWSRV